MGGVRCDREWASKTLIEEYFIDHEVSEIDVQQESAEMIASLGVTFDANPRPSWKKFFGSCRGFRSETLDRFAGMDRLWRVDPE